MKNEDFKAFNEVICATSEMYGGKKPSDIVIALYWKALKLISLDQVKTGISAHMRNTETGQFMPKPADILRPFARPPKDAVIAWRQVEETMREIGSYMTIQFEDGIINAVIQDMGGWPWICSQNIDEPWTQKEFERRYLAYRAQGIDLHRPLIGLHERDNQQKGLTEWIPKTQLVLEDGGRKLLEPANPDPNEPVKFGELVKSME